MAKSERTGEGLEQQAHDEQCPSAVSGSCQEGGHQTDWAIDVPLFAKILRTELGESLAHPRDDEADGSFVGGDDADVLFAGGAASSCPGGGGDPEVSGGGGEGRTGKGGYKTRRRQ